MKGLAAIKFDLLGFISAQDALGTPGYAQVRAHGLMLWIESDLEQAR
jgi:hypothetical protein